MTLATVAVRIQVAPTIALAYCPPVSVPAPERWAPIPSAPGYSASDRGRVREDGTGRIVHEIDRGGRPGHRYRGVRVAGERVPRALHHLIAEAWIGPRPRGACINHINGCGSDNRPQNLEWSTDRANKRHAVALGLVARGERVANSRLSEAQVREIRRWRGAAPAPEVARAYGIARPTVRDLWSRRRWAWLV